MCEGGVKEFCVRFAKREDVENIVCDKLDSIAKTDILLPKDGILLRIASSFVWIAVMYLLNQRVIADDASSFKKLLIILALTFLLLSANFNVMANIVIIAKFLYDYIKYYNGQCIRVKLQVQLIDQENDSITYIEPISGKLLTFYTIYNLEETLEVGDTNEIIIIYK